jgi:hypothetical protein
MKEQFINSKIIGIIYKNLISKLSLELNSDQKTKLTRKIIYVMNQIFANIDVKRVNDNNYKHILRQFINNSYQIVYNDINKENISKKEKFSQDSHMNRDQNLYGDRKNLVTTRPGFVDDKYASFNDSFKMDPRQQNSIGFQGRFNQNENTNFGKKSDFSQSIESRYSELQNEYKQSLNLNVKPNTPPELKGDGGQNLNRLARDNIKIKQESQRAPQMSATEFLKSADPKSNPNISNTVKDNFDFGTINDVDNNYDTLDGSIQDYQGNMDIKQWNTGINPTTFQIDENTPLEQRLKQYQAERNVLDQKQPKEDQKQTREENKKQVRFNNEDIEESQRINQQRMAQQQRKINQNETPMNGGDIRNIREPERNDYRREPERHDYRREPERSDYRRESERDDYDIRQNDPDNKLAEYENTIGLLLDKLKTLQKQQIQVMNNGSNDSDDKIKLLSEKKEEILNEVSRLQNMTEELEEKQKLIQNKEQQIRRKEADIENKIKKYGEMNEKQIIIKASTGKFIHSLNESFTNVTSIQLLNYNIPYDENNINSNNNKLYFNTISEDNKQTEDKVDDDMLSSDTENYVEDVYINSNKLKVMTIPENNYDIYGLIEMMNKIGNKHELQFSLLKGKIVIKTNSNNRLKLYLDREYQNNILSLLGFMKIIGEKNKHVAENKYNINSDKLVQLYIKNISSDPFAEFMINNTKVHKFSKDVNIDNLNKLEIEIKLNEKLFIPQEPYILEFVVLMKNADKRRIENELNTDDDDLLSKVTNMMNLNNYS